MSCNELVPPRLLAIADERTTEVVGKAIGQLLGQQRRELQREIDTLRALLDEARAEQRELRAAIEVLRAERRRGDGDGFTDLPATVPRRVN
jgi:chromosome segregation ATPase